MGSDGLKCVFVTGVPCSGVFMLANQIAKASASQLVQLARDRQVSHYLENWTPCSLSSFEHCDQVTLHKMAAARALEGLRKPAIIEGVGALFIGQDLLSAGHGMVVIQPLPWDTYKKLVLGLTTRLDAHNVRLNYESDYLNCSFLHELHKKFAHKAEELIALQHPRVVVYKNRETIYVNRTKINQVFDLIDSQFRVHAGGFGED